MKNKPWALHWFRRDLRVAGNALLRSSVLKYEGAFLEFFALTRLFWRAPTSQKNRFLFFLNTLVALRAELHALGGDLLVIDQGPFDAFSKLWESLDPEVRENLHVLTWNRDYEPFARARDDRMTQWAKGRGLRIETGRDHLLLEPDEVLRDGSSEDRMYKVYSPFFSEMG